MAYKASEKNEQNDPSCFEAKEGSGSLWRWQMRFEFLGVFCKYIIAARPLHA